LLVQTKLPLTKTKPWRLAMIVGWGECIYLTTQVAQLSLTKRATRSFTANGKILKQSRNHNHPHLWGWHGVLLVTLDIPTYLC